MKVLIYSQRDKSRIQDLPGHVYTQQEKTRRALKRLFGLLGLALASVLVPVFHFVLVPTFLILAPFVAYKSYLAEGTLEEVDLECPECGKKGLFAKNSGRWPLHNICPACLNRVYFDLSQ